LLECGYEDICDEFWYVYSSPEIRRARMKETRGYSDEKVDAVMKSQMQDEQAMQMCDFVIVNNSTLEEVKRQLSEHFGA
jgi:dephospho-CoA kinase